MESVDDKQNTLLARLDERMKALDQKIDAILVQTTKTNGRLTKAEDSIYDLNLWQSKVKGSYNAIMVIGSIISVIIGYAISNL
jgi:hypothetical protein